MTFTIVPLPGATTVVCKRSHLAVSSCARVVAADAWETLTCAAAVAICALTCGDRCQVPVDATAQFLAHLLFVGARRGNLTGQLVDAGLRLFEIEAVARARLTSSVFCATRFCEQDRVKPQCCDLASRLLQLFVQLSLARLRVGQFGLCLRRAAPICVDLGFLRGQLRLERITWF